MKTLLLPVMLFSLLLVGCATVDTRIRENQTAFNSWPADVQAKIRAGRVDLGFTPEQVRVALGEPDRMFTRKSSTGEAEVWAYFDNRPRFSFGVGVGSGGYSGAAGGVTYDRTYERMDDAIKVIFEGGVVTSVEARLDKK